MNTQVFGESYQMIELSCEILSVRCIWFNVLIISRRFFTGESTLSICLNLKELLDQKRCNIWNLSDCNGTQTHNELLHERSLNYLAQLIKWLNWSLKLRVLICTMHLTVCSYHVMQAFHSESTLYICRISRTPCSKQARDLKFHWLQEDSNL